MGYLEAYHSYDKGVSLEDPFISRQKSFVACTDDTGMADEFAAAPSAGQVA